VNKIRVVILVNMNRWSLLLLSVIVLISAFLLRNYLSPLKYVSSQEPPEYEGREGGVSVRPLLFTGDIMLGRYVETLSNRAQDEMYPFNGISGYLKRRTVISNLEGPIPDIHRPTPINGFSFSFPSSTPRILKSAGVTAVSLANNHMFDKGRSGWEETKRALDAEGVAHFGGYAPTESDYFETSLGTTTVIVYGITMIAAGWDEAEAIEVTNRLRSEHPDAYLVAYLHWGDEYVTQNRYQRAFAYRLIDGGVDAIIGSHPHVIQGVETYKRKPIFYSLGNFIFDQYWRKDLEDGLLVELVEKGLWYEYNLIPIRSVRSVPYVATSTERDRILEVVSRQSESYIRKDILGGVLRIYR
jgi:poly-gamma-glutamate capsule biosynthesis protein CapA/YwtB (metallophosphatase superfamily)